MYKLNSIDKHKCNIQKVTDIIDYKYLKKELRIQLKFNYKDM